MRGLFLLIVPVLLLAQTPRAVTRFVGHGAPGSLPTSILGDKYIDSDAGKEYTCFSASGGCKTVAVGGWVFAGTGATCGTPNCAVAGSLTVGVNTASQTRLSTRNDASQDCSDYVGASAYCVTAVTDGTPLFNAVGIESKGTPLTSSQGLYVRSESGNPDGIEVDTFTNSSMQISTGYIYVANAAGDAVGGQNMVVGYQYAANLPNFQFSTVQQYDARNDTASDEVYSYVSEVTSVAGKPRFTFYGSGGAPARPSSPGLFSRLPACASGVEGAQAPVSDSVTSTWGATITGTGGSHVLAYCNGTNWTVMAK